MIKSKTFLIPAAQENILCGFLGSLDPQESCMVTYHLRSYCLYNFKIFPKSKDLSGFYLFEFQEEQTVDEFTIPSFEEHQNAGVFYQDSHGKFVRA